MEATEATSSSANTTSNAKADLDLSKAQVLTADKAAEAGFRLSEDALKPEVCPYCGTERYKLCIVGGLVASIIVTLTYEPCDCEGAKQAAIEREEKRKLEQAEEERRKEAERIMALAERAFTQSEMPQRWKRYTLDTFNAYDAATENAKNRASNFAQWFIREARNGNTGSRIPNGLMLVGSSGTGKTHLAAAVLNAIIEQAPEIPVIGAAMGELLSKLKSTYGSYSEDGKAVREDELIKLYADIPLLLIDDLGSEQMTEWAIDRIFAIVNKRYNENKPTIVTSNFADDYDLAQRLTPQGQPAAMGAKVADRLAEMCRRVVLDGKSYRSNNHASTDTAETLRNAPVCYLKSSGDRLQG